MTWDIRFYGHLPGPVTLAPVALRLTVQLSLPVLNKQSQANKKTLERNKQVIIETIENMKETSWYRISISIRSIFLFL